MEEHIFLQISMLLGITVLIAFFIRMLKQPLMVAYIIAGIVSGPLFLNLLKGDKDLLSSFSHIGVVLLLFVVGLSLDFNHLRKIGKVAVITGAGQVLITFIIGYLILFSLGFNTVSAVYIATAITFSSTIIITKLLADKKDLESTYGRYTIGLMLVQDVIAILIMVMINTFNKGEDISSSVIVLFMKSFVLISALFIVSRYFLPRLLDKVSDSGEFLFVFTLTWCFGVASLVHWAGFSAEIGAIAAGLTLGSSPYQTEISSRIKPLRDFFIVLFFIILGSEMGMANLGEIVLPGIMLSLFILIGSPIILYVLFRLLKFTRRNSFLAGVTAAQVSEFGFVLLFTGQQIGHLNGQELPIFTMVALVTIFISSYLITYNYQLYNLLRPIFSLFGKDRHYQTNNKTMRYDIWVFGCHRIGWKLCETLLEKNMKFAVVDYNPDIVKKIDMMNIPAYYGDASDIEFLESLPLQKAKLIIITTPDPEDQKTIISYIRHHNSKAFIVANLYHYAYLEELYNVGANYVMMPHLLGGKWIAEILKNNNLNKRTFNKLRKEQHAEHIFTLC